MPEIHSGDMFAVGLPSAPRALIPSIRRYRTTRQARAGAQTQFFVSMVWLSGRLPVLLLIVGGWWASVCCADGLDGASPALNRETENHIQNLEL